MKPAKYSKYILYLLLIVSVVAGGFFFFGGKSVSATGVGIPVYTGLLIFVLVAILGAALAVTILALTARLAERFRRSPKQAVRSILGFFILAFVMLFWWLCGNGTPLCLKGYIGNYNTSCWLKLTDMFLYTTYTLIGGAILLIIGFFIAKKVR
ncbi:hypothetical protein [uncultured Bacteroides sp.]|jgi:hypothetical protein|uniref:hypothetical protein n=1 Tax=uncultured Bacteroides sp. TaxID=162156 RepID=UPI002AA73D26|nr:hypothetical protein [uncultured Bacteroides sp.]